jgi:ABC-type multidrug transport system fused ATPase/permease subunit
MSSREIKKSSTNTTHIMQGTAPTLPAAPHYKHAITFFFLIGLTVLLPIFILHSLALGLDLPEWLLAAIFGVISPLVSGMGYKGKLLDRIAGATNPKTSKSAIKTAGESMGLVIGLVAAATVFILSIVFHMVVPFGNVLGSLLGIFMMGVGNASLFMGLSSRAGKVVDYFRDASQKENIFRQEKVNYVLAVGIGILVGAAIVAATFASGGTLGVVAVIGCISTCASASGYIGICADFLLGKRTIVGAIADIFTGNEDKASSLASRATPEAIGTVIGVSIGIIVAIALIASGVGLPILGAGVFVLAPALISAGGGLGNRLGHVMSKVSAVREEEMEVIEENKEEVKEKPESLKLCLAPNQKLEKAPEWKWNKAYTSAKPAMLSCKLGQFCEKPSVAAREPAVNEQAEWASLCHGLAGSR